MIESANDAAGAGAATADARRCAPFGLTAARSALAFGQRAPSISWKPKLPQPRRRQGAKPAAAARQVGRGEAHPTGMVFRRKLAHLGI
jgi:hypothetical protein